MSNKGSLTLVGSGITFYTHLTIQAKAYIEQSDVVLYLVNNPMMEEWIKTVAIYSETLEPLYSSYENRANSYAAITKYILAKVYDLKNVCVVVYGHPTFFSLPGLRAVQLATEKGIDSLILPGISALDCLIADLQIEVGKTGIQSYEATDFLAYERNFDPTSHLILWQVDVIGNPTHTISTNKIGVTMLKKRLIQTYGADHIAIIYEGALFPSMKPRIERVALTEIDSIACSPISTMYIAPLPSPPPNPEITNLLTF